jgi:hypothetical protein
MQFTTNSSSNSSDWNIATSYYQLLVRILSPHLEKKLGKRVLQYVTMCNFHHLRKYIILIFVGFGLVVGSQHSEK